MIFYNLPPIIGLGTGSGFEFQLLSLDRRARRRHRGGGARPGLRRQPEPGAAARLHHLLRPTRRSSTSTSTATRCRRWASRSRRCLQHAAGGAGQRLCQRLQPVRPHLAGGRAGRGVGPQQDRRHLPRSTCATTTGEMVPVRAFAEARLILGPQSLIRFNNVRSATINGGPAPGFSSGEAIAAMERSSAAALPQGYGYEWTGTALQEKEASGKTTMILGPGRAVRLSLPRRALRELDHPGRGAALGDGRRHGFDAGAEDGRGSTTISTRRSASWC